MVLPQKNLTTQKNFNETQKRLGKQNTTSQLIKPKKREYRDFYFTLRIELASVFIFALLSEQSMVLYVCLADFEKIFDSYVNGMETVIIRYNNLLLSRVLAHIGGPELIHQSKVENHNKIRLPNTHLTTTKSDLTRIFSEFSRSNIIFVCTQKIITKIRCYFQVKIVGIFR